MFTNDAAPRDSTVYGQRTGKQQKVSGRRHDLFDTFTFYYSGDSVATREHIRCQWKGWGAPQDYYGDLKKTDLQCTHYTDDEE